MKKKNKNNHFELKNSNIKPLSSFTIFLIIFSSSISILAIVSIIINNTNITLLQTSSPLFYIIIVLIISEIAAMLVYIFYTKKITKGFEIIMEAADHIADGDFNYKIEKSIPKEFEPLKTRMNNVLENLKKLEISKNDYTAYFSHEFKTPLASIIGFAKILKNNDLSLTERNEYISIIIEESERLSKLANNNLLLNKIDNKTLILKKENILLNKQICDCVLLLEYKWNAKKINVNIEMNDNLYYYGDSGLLKEVWINIIDNAIKFTNELGTITISGQKENEKSIISINDDGIGMDNDTIKHIFDCYYQGDKSHYTNGNGLGLTIVKKILDLSNNQIDIDSELNYGTSITITLINKN